MPDKLVSLDPPVPDAPWRLRGEAVAFLAGPLAVRLLVHYTESPVGPYDEHALATLSRRGPHVLQMSVNLEASMIGGRRIWGFPKTLENVSWRRKGARVRFQREGQEFRIRAFGPRFFLALPFWTAQQKEGEWVRVPGHIRAQARLAFRGPQLALALDEFEMNFQPVQ